MKPALAVLFAVSAFAQTGALSPVPLQQPLDNSGRTLGGSCLYSYAAGTTTPQLTYSDAGLTSPNTNPVVINGFGRQPAVYLQALSYKLVLAYPVTGSCPGSPGTVIWSQDNVYDFGQVYKVLLTGPTGAAQIGFTSGGTVPVTLASALNSTFSYDISFPTAALACASTKTVAVTNSGMWAAMATQTCSAPLWFPAGTGAQVQSAANATVTLSSPPACLSGAWCFDTSLGGAGSIVFSGGGIVPDASWFGASPSASAAVNTLAIQSAIYATPIILNGSGMPAGYAGDSGAVVTNVPLRYGSVATIGCGAYQVNGSIYLIQQHELRLLCGEGGNGEPNGVVSLNLANGTFTSGNHYMLQVLMTLSGGFGGEPGPNGTFGVRITGGLSLNVNGFNNAGGSGLLFYGAEGSYFEMGSTINYAVRGLGIGAPLAEDGLLVYSAPSDIVKGSVGEVSGLVGTPGTWSTGEALYYHCQNCIVHGSFHHNNGGGTYTGAAVPAGIGTATASGGTVTCVTGCPFNAGWPGQQITFNSASYIVQSVAAGGATMILTGSGTVASPAAFSVTAELNPTVWVDSSFASTVGYGSSECDPRWAEVTHSQGITFDNVSPSAAANYTGCASTPQATAIRISGDSGEISAWGQTSFYTNAIEDLSTSPITYVAGQLTFNGTFGHYSNAIHKLPNGLQIANSSVFNSGDGLVIMDKSPSGGNTALSVPCAAGQTGHVPVLNSYNPMGNAIAMEAFCDGFLQIGGAGPGNYTFGGSGNIPATFPAGTIISIGNANTNTPGAAITTTGADRVLAVYSGSSWIVIIGY